MSSWESSACYPRSTFYPLSDAVSIHLHRITKPNFRSCSGCLPPSQAPLCLYTLNRPVTNRPEGTFGSLRYAFGGDHPSQTARQARSESHPLGAKRRKGRISTVAPRTLACPILSLRPILHILRPAPTLSCSKGSRGLFVPSRVIGIFTDTTISLESRLRQCPDHYTIRAGRNLPDKEFRYLRTVIVTAAVYWGFNSYLRDCSLSTPLNLPAPGRCQAVYGVFRLCTALCFW